MLNYNTSYIYDERDILISNKYREPIGKKSGSVIVIKGPLEAFRGSWEGESFWNSASVLPPLSLAWRSLSSLPLLLSLKIMVSFSWIWCIFFGFSA